MKNKIKKIYVISESFDKNAGQGIFKFAHYLCEGLSKHVKINKIEIEKSKGKIDYIYNLTRGVLKKCTDKEGIYLFMCPEYSYSSKFLKNSFVVVEDMLPINFPGERDWKFVLFWKYCWNIAKKQKLISISMETKSEVIKNIYKKELEQNNNLIKKYMEDRIKNIYLGVDKKQFKPLKRKANEIFTVGYVGGFGKRKNVEMILKVAKLLPEIKFKIAGKGGNSEYLKSIAPVNVSFVGFIDERDLCMYYNSLDLFLFPDLMDGWSLPAVEAMACGIPPLLNNKGVFKEVIYPIKNGVLQGDSCAGRLTDMENPKDIAKEILQIKNNKKELNTLKNNSLKKIKELNWDKTAKEYYEFIKKNI